MFASKIGPIKGFRLDLGKKNLDPSHSLIPIYFFGSKLNSDLLGLKKLNLNPQNRGE